MKHRRSIARISGIIAGAAALALGARAWSIAHIRTWTGRNDLSVVSCNHCHLNALEDLPWQQARRKHPTPYGMACSADGSTLYIACGEIDEVIEADVSALRIRRRAKIPGKPVALALNASGSILYAALQDEDAVTAIRTLDLRPVNSIEVGSGPVSLTTCRSKEGERLVVVNSVSDNVSVLCTDPLKEIARPQAGREPYAVAASRGGDVAYVANRLATTETVLSVPKSELTLLDPNRGRVLTRVELTSAHLSEGTAIVDSLGWCLTPIIKVRNLVPITQVANGWVMSSGLAITDRSGRVGQVPLDEAHAYYADPSGIAVDDIGKRAYIASAGSDAITVVDLKRLSKWLAQADQPTRNEAIDDLTLSAEYVVARILSGRNPRHLTLSADGKTLFVSEHLNDSVQVINTETLSTRGRIVLGDGGLADPIRRGERVFTSSRHAFQHQFSCRSCHPDGHVDGLAYDFDGDGIGDNLLDNRSLQGLAGTEPFKWNGKNPSLSVQCGPRFARVLMRTDPIPEADMDDLAAFVKSQPPPRWERKRQQPLTAQQERGKAIFFATTLPNGAALPRERRCHTCHRPPLFTNRLLADVGSRGPRDSTNLFDTPHLLGIAHTAPYLHDGRARALEELWTVHQTNDMHGVSSYMNKHQLNDLVEYLKTL